MPLQITITDAGLAEIVNAENTGTAPVVIAEVGIGTGQYTPTPSQTALVAEIKRLDTIAGVLVSDDTIHVTIRDDSADAYDASEFGLYTASGTLFAVYSQTSGPFFEKTPQAILLLSTDIVLTTLDTASLTFGDVSFVNPPASESTLGVVRLATDAEVQAGSNTLKSITPAGLSARTATESRTGVVELATDAEVQAGADTSRAVTPAGLRAETAIAATANRIVRRNSDGTANVATPSQFDDDDSAASTAFVQRALGNASGFRGIVANASLTAADAGKIIYASSTTGSISISLPAASSMKAGVRYEIYNTGVDDVIVTRVGGDTIVVSNTTNTVTAVTLKAGDSIELICLGAGSLWYHAGGTAQLKNASGQFGASLASSGYQLLPSGLIMQWGKANVSSSGLSISFPISFPTVALGVHLVMESSSAPVGEFNPQYSSLTLSGAVINNGRGVTTLTFWTAIGY